MSTKDNEGKGRRAPTPEAGQTFENADMLALGEKVNASNLPPDDKLYVLTVLMQYAALSNRPSVVEKDEETVREVLAELVRLQALPRLSGDEVMEYNDAWQKAREVLSRTTEVSGATHLQVGGNDEQRQSSVEQVHERRQAEVLDDSRAASPRVQVREGDLRERILSASEGVPSDRFTDVKDGESHTSIESKINQAAEEIAQLMSDYGPRAEAFVAILRKHFIESKEDV